MLPDLDPLALAERLATDEPLLLLDIREQYEWEICRLPGALHVPMSELPGRLATLDSGREMLVYCHHGVRSRMATAWLRNEGYERVRDLLGGIEAWAREVDPEMSRY